MVTFITKLEVALIESLALDMVAGTTVWTAAEPKSSAGAGPKSSAGSAPTPTAVTAQGEAAATKILAQNPGVLAKSRSAGRWMQQKAKEAYQRLEKRYGRRQAFMILCAGQVLSWGATITGVAVGTPVWVPGPIAMVPFVALAELIQKLRKDGGRGDATTEAVAHELSQAQLMHLGNKVIKFLISAWEHHNVDVSGGSEVADAASL